MQTNPSRSFYALIHTGTDSGMAGFAPMQSARRLADLFGGTAHAMLVGPDLDAAIDIARVHGLDSVLAVNTGPAPEPLQIHQLADIYASLLSEPGHGRYTPDTLFLVAASAAGEELAGRLASRIEGVPLGTCSHFEMEPDGHLVGHRAAYGARLNIALACRKGPFVAAVRKPDAAARPDIDLAARTTIVHRVDSPAPSRAPYAVTTSSRQEQHASLDGARLVVSGGRGIGSEAGFDSLYKLAEKLGGAVGGSLPAIDAGWAPVARQVGQSGKYVSPDIYIAIGISGTAQHLAGIDPHTEIIAINQDPDADIFRAARVGVIADWQEFLPALIAAIDNVH